MTLRTAALRIDPVAVALDGERVFALEEPVHRREFLQSFIALASPGVAENHDGGGTAALEIADELGTEGPDARIPLVVEEVEVVEKARRLPQVEPQERVNATLGHVHDLHRVAGAREAGKVAHQGGDASLLFGDPAGVGGLHALDAKQSDGDDEHDRGESARPAHGLGLLRFRGDRNGRQRTEEDRQRIEVVLPPLALSREMKEAIDGAGQREPAPDAERLLDAYEDSENAEDDQAAPDLPAIDVPSDSFPHRHTPDAAVERQHIACGNGQKGARASAPGEPGHDGRGDSEPGRAPDRQGAERAGAPLAPRRNGRARDPEERRLRLDHDSRASGEPSPEKRRAGTSRLPRPRRAPRGQHQKEYQEKIALARPPRPAGEVVEDEKQRRTEPAPGIAHAPRKSEERRGGQAEPREIEEPPGAVALSQHPDHAQMQEVDAGYVHVEDIAVGNRAQADEPRDVVHDGGVVNQRPAPRAPAEIDRERGASGQDKLQSLARRSG